MMMVMITQKKQNFRQSMACPEHEAAFAAPSASLSAAKRSALARCVKPHPKHCGAWASGLGFRISGLWFSTDGIRGAGLWNIARKGRSVCEAWLGYRVKGPVTCTEKKYNNDAIDK